MQESRLKLLTSSQNEHVKQLNRLIEQGRERRKLGLAVLEGIHLCQAAQAAGWALTQLFVNTHAESKPEVTAILRQLPSTTPVWGLDEQIFSKVTALRSAPELLAVCQRLAGPPPARGESILLLEDLQDPGNMGTILRSAAASGLRQVYLSAACADVFSPKVLRAGMGAHFALSIHEQADLSAVLAGFAGTRLVTSLNGDRSLYQQDLRGPVAFVFGNEGNGVSSALLAEADAQLRIPMPGQAESLNVAMAATLCLFERVRQLQPTAQV